MLVLVLLLGSCHGGARPSDKSAIEETSPGATLQTTAASQPAGPSSVRVYIEMVAEKKYGLLAHLVGKQDITVRHTVYDPDKKWWDNPMIVYGEAPFAHPDAIGHADAEAIFGAGASANVDVRLTLVPHVDVAVMTTPKCDGIKGAITVSISAVADFFDEDWTEMVRVKEKRLTFSFDTCDPGRPLEQVMHETRNIPAFSLERYSRGHQKWEPKSCWPDKSKSGDGRTVIYGQDAILDVTGYRYVAP